MKEYPIDFIITWVDGSDPEWIAEKNRYKGVNADGRASRYRDWDTLRYLLRSIEVNAPWVRNVFLVTCGHLPKWLNTEHPKLKLVKHSDYIPEEYLPTFSSRAIDMNFHRIDALAEHFVYFNDDMILLGKTKKEDFFVNGLPCDTAILRPAVVTLNKKGIKETTSQMYLAPIIDMALINKYFSKHRSIRKNLSKWYSPRYGREIIKTFLMSGWNFFPGIREYHCCYSYLKSTYKEVWDLEEEALSEVCRHRFRVNTDYNHWVFSYWQIAKGLFYPRDPQFGKAFSLTDDAEQNEKIFDVLRNRKYRLVCINDSVSDGNYDAISGQLTEVMEKLLPQKSEYEI